MIPGISYRMGIIIPAKIGSFSRVDSLDKYLALSAFRRLPIIPANSILPLRDTRNTVNSLYPGPFLRSLLRQKANCWNALQHCNLSRSQEARTTHLIPTDIL